MKTTRKDRTCLRCEGIFSSPGPHIRKCGLCFGDEKKFEYYSELINGERERIHDLPKGHRKGIRVKARTDGFFE